MTELLPTGAHSATLLQITRSGDEFGVALELRGELDLSSAPELSRQLSEIARERPGRIVIDLSGLSFMDSTGLALMIRAQRAAQAIGCRFCLRSASRQVRRLFALSGVLERFTFES